MKYIAAIKLIVTSLVLAVLAFGINACSKNEPQPQPQPEPQPQPQPQPDSEAIEHLDTLSGFYWVAVHKGYYTAPPNDPEIDTFYGNYKVSVIISNNKTIRFIDTVSPIAYTFFNGRNRDFDTDSVIFFGGHPSQSSIYLNKYTGHIFINDRVYSMGAYPYKTWEGDKIP